jgi:hypothetical protein
MEELTIKQLADKVLFRQVNGIVFRGKTKDFIVQKIKEIKKSLENIRIKDDVFNKYLEVYFSTNENLFDLIIINTDNEQLDERKRYLVLYFITKIFKDEKVNSIREYLKNMRVLTKDRNYYIC